MSDKTLSKNGVDFIDDNRLEELLKRTIPDGHRINDIIVKSLEKKALAIDETADLILASDPENTEQIFDAARQLKREVYGNRIVLFAPLYIGNYCVNECYYCAFKRSNKMAVRRTLSPDEISHQVKALENVGHKRLILVFGEHPKYNADYIARTVKHVYDVKEGRGAIRRVNINAAPLDAAGFKTVKESGIGTYQIFQETYHHETYRRYHPPDTLKGDYLWRLDGLSRAFEAGADDMGIGALFGLYDWRFEVLGLVTHSLHLQQKYNVGPHTISFPRIRPAAGVTIDTKYAVNDIDFKRLIAILRLSVPYTGMILTAREKPDIRRTVMEFGVSQIDAGSRIELGGYTEAGDAQVMEHEQFSLGDTRSLDEIMRELMQTGFIPSFCTACYRLGRTGEQFMEFAVPGWIHDYCSPNALSTLMEYLVDYASPETRDIGLKLIERELENIDNPDVRTRLKHFLKRIQTSSDRDLYF
jgi:2-iminoacetate synthase